MRITAEVVQLGHHWYCLCRVCEWRSAPQESQSDAADRAVSHDYFRHKDSPDAVAVREMEHAHARSLDEQQRQAKESAS